MEQCDFNTLDDRHFFIMSFKGSLQRKTGIIKSWKKRFFAIEGEFLVEYAKEGGTAEEKYKISDIQASADPKCKNTIRAG